MKYSYLLRKKHKNIAIEEQHKEIEEVGASGVWNSFSESGLTKSYPDAKMKSEKEFIALNSDGDIKKLEEKDLRKNKVSQDKKLDLVSLNVGYYILVPLIGGTFFGVLLDNYFKTRPLFIGIFLFLGVVAGFYNLLKLLRNE